MSNTEPRTPVLVSACLLGLPTRYDGRHRRSEALLRRLRKQNLLAVPVCPEQLGGLPTPRPPAHIERGDGHSVLDGRARVLNMNEDDVTVDYVRGAEAALTVAKLTGARRAFLKSKSPSCGLRCIKRGGETLAGSGVAAALLQRAGLEIEEID